ncbi:MAG: plasmid mobilization protein [Ginsengibacter sp.]
METKSRKVTIRFTPGEYAKINQKCSRSTSPQLSHYMRQVLLEKPVVVKYRNESLDQVMEEMVVLRKELNNIGNNLNQAVRKLHTLSRIPEFRNWLEIHLNLLNALLKKKEEIDQAISKMSGKWLQE